MAWSLRWGNWDLKGYPDPPLSLFGNMKGVQAGVKFITATFDGPHNQRVDTVELMIKDTESALPGHSHADGGTVSMRCYEQQSNSCGLY